MKTPILSFRPAFFALIGLLLPPLAVAHEWPYPADSVHFPRYDFEQWERDRPRPAAKRLANLNVGEPPTVRLIYFRPNDRPFRQEVVDAMKAVIRHTQTFFAEQMQAHGYGEATFRFETDEKGEPLIHIVEGQYPDSHYSFDGGDGGSIPASEFSTLLRNKVFFLVYDLSFVPVSGGRNGKASGSAEYAAEGILAASRSWSPGEYPFYVVVHELGHAFGLEHDWRDGVYVLSYGPPGWERLSACAAKFLSVHPYFNPEIPIEETSAPTIELISSPEYPTGATSVHVRLRVSDSDGLHQVILHAHGGVKAWQGMKGEQEAVVEFDYDGVVSAPPFDDLIGASLSSPPVHPILVHAVDTGGTIGRTRFELFDVSTRDISIATLEGHTSWVHSVAFSPDGATLASGGDRTIKLWDVATRANVATLEGHTSWVHSVAFSPDGATLASSGGTDRTIKLWDVATRANVATLEGHTSQVYSVAFSPDGATLASGEGDGTIKLWDVATRANVATLEGHTGWVNSVAFSPDGATLASGEGDGNTVKLWDVAMRANIATLSRAGPVAFSPNGKTLALRQGYNTVELWDVATREGIATLEGHTSTVLSVSFSPDGAVLASGSYDATVRLWDVVTGSNMATLFGGGEVYSVSFSPDGTMLASGSEERTVKLWDVSRYTEPRPYALAIISGEDQQGPAGAVLAEPFVVSVLDQNGSAFAGAIVTFAVTAGGGTLSTTTATTDANGRARSTLTLGDDPGTNTVTAIVEGLKPVTFTVTGKATADSDDEEDVGEDQQESEEQPTSTVELAGISSSHDSVREDDGQATTITVTVTLDKTARTDETITLAIVSPTQGKTAKRGEDFDASLDETITIAKGERTGTAQLILTPKDNTTADGDKAFAVQATSSSGHAALINIKIIDNDSADEPQAWLTPDPAEVQFNADDPAWKTFTVHTNLDSVLVRANPPGSDPAIEVAGGQQVPSRDFCPAEGNDRPTRGRRDSWSLHVKACQAGQTKILLIDYDTGEIVQQYEVNVEAATSAAASTALNPNYPNPFNSETVLSYTLPTASAIRLEVFTLSGQRVAVLHEGFQAAGYHTIAMDASALASGVYLYRLTTPEGRFVQKFTLLR